MSASTGQTTVKIWSMQMGQISGTIKFVSLCQAKKLFWGKHHLGMEVVDKFKH